MSQPAAFLRPGGYYLVALIWTLTLASSLIWSRHSSHSQALAIARTQARVALEKDILYRHWNAMHGGVYVKVDETTQPNPFLDDTDRDLTTVTGKRLTKINPAYMTRQVHELAKKFSGVKGHITSLNPIRPANKADPWETEALEQFESGSDEVSEVIEISGQPHIRLMWPLETDETCLPCHAEQGYELGDVRGGISVTAPLSELYSSEERHATVIAVTHLVVWLMGMTGVGIGFRMQRKRQLELSHVLKDLRTANKDAAEANQDLAMAVDRANALAREADLERITIQELNRQLEASIDTANLLAIEADAANHAKSQFLANMSHEIRTPMNAILGFSEILESRIEDPQDREFLNAISSSGKTLLDLINDVLDLSKIEAGKLVIDPQPVSITQIFREIYLLMEQRAVGKGLKFTLDVQEGLPDGLLLDDLRIKQVVLNLLGNAIKFTLKGSVTLRVRYSRSEQSSSLVDLSIEIQDTGVGIPKEQHDAIFNEFVQADGQDQRRFGGTGLGLTITRKLVALMNGTVSLESEEGIGSTFIVHLPNIDVAAIEDDSRQVEKAWRNITFEPATILLIEDNHLNQKLMRAFLAPTNLSLVVANHGKEGLDLARAHKPDLVVTDLFMPEMDGQETITHFKADSELSDIPIIALSATVMHEQEEKAKAAGAAVFLRKPVTREKLIATLTQYLDHTSKNPAFMKSELSAVHVVHGTLSLNRKDIDNAIRELTADIHERWKELGTAYSQAEARSVINKIQEISRKYGLEGFSRLADQALYYMDNMILEKFIELIPEYDHLLSQLEQTKGNKRQNTPHADQ